MTLNLGSRIEGASTPSFGNNATIDGTVYIKDWKHVKEIVLTVRIRSPIQSALLMVYF